MKNEQKKITAGCLLHDIGKLVNCKNKTCTHSESGEWFLKENVKILDVDVLEQVRYHHGEDLKDADIRENSPAYITYMANKIASGNSSKSDLEAKTGFIGDIRLKSIFNHLNQKQGNASYKQSLMEKGEDIQYPEENLTAENTKNRLSGRSMQEFYDAILRKIYDRLCMTDFQKDEVNSLLGMLESLLSFVPSAASDSDREDISMYDHVKYTAAIANAIYAYLEEQQEEDFRTRLYDNDAAFWDEEVFLLFSMDISGIQDFIYTINSKGALKGLRARSFYLEIMMEQMIDELLDMTSLSRASLIYSGGGHAYLLLPNTNECIQAVTVFERSVNAWFLDVFGASLYVGCGYVACSASELNNEPKGSYTELFRKVSNMIGEKKLSRYEASDIIRLNNKKQQAGKRECSICRRTDRLRKDDNKCDICWSLEQLSGKILDCNFFAVVTKPDQISLPLPNNKYMITVEKLPLQDKEKYQDRENGFGQCVRVYSKNQFYTDSSVATNLWVGDYKNGYDFETLAHHAEGIERIAVLRADVDNLGEAFVSGFRDEKRGDRYLALSRTATFSRKLSIFFKYHINGLLENGSFFLRERKDKRRNAVIVYSGGDDLFLVGSWDDVIGFAVDLYHSLKRFTQETLSISGGISMYPPKYPIAVMARETGALEEAAKDCDGKNAAALFERGYAFHWDKLIHEVIGRKFVVIRTFMDHIDQERGKSFLYRLLELIRATWVGSEGKINIARFAYQLARVEPSKKETELYQLYQEFSQHMYRWIKSKEDARQLEMAIYLYVYLIRDRKEEYNGI